MTPEQETVLRNVTFRDEFPALGDSRQELLAGLQDSRKTIDPKFFYDQRGSELFSQITTLAEYYPTRTEKAILSDNSEEICTFCESDCLFVEPGSGSSEKVRLLLDNLRPSAYVPVDISADYLRQAAIALGREYPWLQVHAVCADFNLGWSFTESLPDAKRVIFYPGSTIGNLEPLQAQQFLRRLHPVIGSRGGVLIGVDLHKSGEQLHAAYNDSAGITAAFNLNVLNRVNHLLDAEFESGLFQHRAFYDQERKRIEMHLVSARAQTIRCNGSTIDFAEGETIHTENSYKYTRAGFAELAHKSGFSVAKSWLDQDHLFSVHYLRPIQR